MDFKQILSAFLVKVYNITSEEAAALLDKADATEAEISGALQEKDKERVKKLKTDSYNDGHKKAKGETLDAYEADIRKHFEIQDANLKGVDLVTHILSLQKTDDGGKTLTEDAVKKHPLFIAQADAHKKALQAANDEWKTRYNDLEGSHAKKSLLEQVKADAATVLANLKPVFDEDENIAANSRRLFAREVTEGVDYEKQGERWVILKDGKVLEDDHGNAIDFDTYVKGKASTMFRFQQTDVGGNAGGKTPVTGAGGKGKTKDGKYTVPTTLEDFAKMVDDPTIPADSKVEISELYEASQAK